MISHQGFTGMWLIGPMWICSPFAPPLSSGRPPQITPVFCYYLEIFRACNKHRERVKDFPQPFVDRLFEVIILENSNVGWVERSDTHQLQLAQAMGFAKGSTHPTRRRRGTCAVAVIAKFADYAGAGHLAV